MHDILTVCWKEWRELLFQCSARNLRELLFHSAGRNLSFLLSLALIVGLFGIAMPWSEGADWVDSGTTAPLWIWLPPLLLGPVICESFAGERERHTLESLLATRLPDAAILYGKLAAAVAYAWGITMTGFVCGLSVVNVVHGHGRLLMFRPVLLAAVVFLSLLMTLPVAAVGVLVSLRARTVRSAQMVMGYAVFALIFGFSYGIGGLPKPWKDRVIAWVTGGSLWRAEIAIGAVLLAVSLLLIAAARLRFRRARLIMG